MEKNKDIFTVNNKECCTTRSVLWYLVFTGFAVNYMIRLNLNISIVSMVKPRAKNNFSLASECFQDTTYNILYTNNSYQNILNNSNISNFIPTKQIQKSKTYSWNEKEQSNILGSYFWLHWTTQIPGGMLASKYGTKLVFGLSNFFGILCCFFIPLAATMGHYYLILVRIIQGVLCGFAWPSMHNMTARWIPPNERSKFVTAYLGSSVGAAVTYPLCGFIIDKWGWELAFHTTGMLGCVWFVAWWFLVYDSPSDHPRISKNEKDYIISSIGQNYSQKKAPVPWKDLFTSLPVWMNILAQWGGVWGLFTLMTHTPTYFKFIHGWNIRATGLLSGMPHVLRMIWAYIFSRIGDYILKTNKLSTTNVRKLATASCTIGQGICMLGLSFTGCNYTAALIFLSFAITLNGSVSTGPLASIVDISPNYASIVLGIVNTLVAAVGFFTPAVVGYFTYNNQTVQQWQKVYWIATIMLMVSGIVYVLFSKSEIQPWNSPKENTLPECELMIIKAKKQKTTSKNT